MKKFYQSVNVLPKNFLQLNAPSIWIRDFMPITSSRKELIGFYYECQYLSDFGEPSFDVECIWAQYCNKVYHARIIADGAHFMELDRHWLVSESVARENSHLLKSDLSNYLENLLGKKILWMEPMPGDPFGHLDGIIAVMGVNRLGIYSNDYYQDYLTLMSHQLRNHGYAVIEFPVYFNNHNELSAEGLFLNFASDDSSVFLPIQEEGNVESHTLERLLGKKIKWVNDVGSYLALGGGLHCLTWEK